MNWPQYTYLALSAMSLGAILAKHGEPRTGNYNFILTFALTAGTIALLYAGGFFG